MYEAFELNVLAFFNLPAWGEILIIAFVGLLIFGKRLPDVARSLGKSVVEFKKGIKDVQDEVSSAGSSNDSKPVLEAKKQPTLDAPASNAKTEKASESSD